MKKKKVFIVAVTAFIWLHSLMPPDLSAEESSWLLGLLMSLFGARVTHYFIRKLAHFVEYSILGCALTLAGDSGKNTPCRVLKTGFLVAFLDETLQIFSGRGSSVPDVWLDLSGVATGMCLTFLAVYLAKKVQAS